MPLDARREPGEETQMERDEAGRPPRSPATEPAGAGDGEPQVYRVETALRYGIDQVADKVKGLLRPPR